MEKNNRKINMRRPSTVDDFKSELNKYVIVC